MAEKLKISELKRQLKESGQWEQAQAAVQERLSGDLKVFLYTPRGSKTSHLYAHGHSGTSWSLCRQLVDETVPASQIVKLRPAICRTCALEAQQIFSRKPNS
jgi:hypothetical protein